MVATVLKTWLSGALGGALGGALVGLSECAVVLSAGTGDENWILLFSVVSYGLLGAAVGAGAASSWQMLRWGAAAQAGLVFVGVAAAVTLPGLAVARYHVIQRVFHEQLVLRSAQGLVTHAVLLVTVGAVALLAAWTLARVHRRIGLPGLVSALAVLCASTWAAGLATDRSGPPSIQRFARVPADQRKPNLILVVVDTLRADALEPYGAKAGSTPALDRLASESVTFERAYAQSSWTRPSIASILTAQYPSAHKTVHKMDVLPDSAFTLAEALRMHGYWTAGFVTNINVAPVFNFQQGYDEYYYLKPDFYFGASDSATKLAIYKGLRAAREKLFARRMHFRHYYQDAEVLNRSVLKWLDQNPPEPFFLIIHYMDPHDPYFEIPYNGRGVARVADPAPAPERAAELRGLYAQDVSYLDRHLGELLDRLRQTGLYERSILALTADHGEEFQEHGGWWHGTTLYEEALRIPLILKRAGEPSPGSRRPDVARLIDIAPTMLAAAGLPVPAGFQGVDLFSARVAEPIVAETDLEGNQVACVLEGYWKLILANPGNPRGLAPVELYDLSSDPAEKQNLAAAHPERVAQLRGHLERSRRVGLSAALPVESAHGSWVGDPRS